MKKIPLYIYISQSVVAASEVMMIYFLKYLVDSMVEKDLNRLVRLTLYVTIIVILAQVYRIFNMYLVENFIFHKNIKIKNIFMKNIFNLKPQLFNRENVGDYLSLLTNKVERLENDVWRIKIRLVYDIFAFLYTIIIVTFLSWHFTIMYFIVGIGLYFAPKFFENSLSQKQKNLNNTNEIYLSELKSSLDSYETIYGTNTNEYFIENINKINTDFQNAKYAFNFLSELQQNILVTLGIFIQVLSFLLGGFLLINGYITFGSLVTLTSLGNSTYGPMAWIAQKISIIKSFQIVYENMKKYEKQKAFIKKETVSSIDVKNLSISYDNEYILKNINLCFHAGKKYLLYGKSGSGKSTLLRVISGFFETYNGEISYDNKIIKYPNIQIIPQTTNFFSGTIKDNILVGREYNESLFNKIIDTSHIRDFYRENKIITADGLGLSGGQKQRIAIARALYACPNVLIFDEATIGIQKNTVINIINKILEMDQLLFINVTHQFDDKNFKKYDYTLDWDKLII